jgi:hypothetical protein
MRVVLVSSIDEVGAGPQEVVQRFKPSDFSLNDGSVVYCSANLLGDRVQRMKYMYRKLAGGGVFKRRMRPQRLLDEF